MKTLEQIWEIREEVAAEREFIAKRKRICEITDMTPEELDRLEDELLE